MKLISEHIQLLLHRNDCVVVPGLGGFILNHVSAGYDEKEGRYYPSHSLPFFNKQLQSNDGLLAASLVKKEGVDYGQALREIQRFVEQVNESLSDNRDYVLQGMGTFQKNHEGQITFLPDTSCNLFIESYGMTSLEIKPVVKVAEISRKALAPVRKKSRTWISMAASLVILAAAGWWLNYSAQTPFGTQWSSLNPMEWEWNQASKEATPEQEAQPVIEQPVSQPETHAPEQPAESIETPAPVSGNTANTPVVTQADTVYFIVVGAFKKQHNAAHFEQQLKSSGFSATSYSGPDSHLIRVCAEKHTKRFEAEERLPFIRENTHPKAWILAISKDHVN